VERGPGHLPALAAGCGQGRCQRTKIKESSKGFSGQVATANGEWRGDSPVTQEVAVLH